MIVIGKTLWIAPDTPTRCSYFREIWIQSLSWKRYESTNSKKSKQTETPQPGSKLFLWFWENLFVLKKSNKLWEQHIMNDTDISCVERRTETCTQPVNTIFQTFELYVLLISEFAKVNVHELFWQ